MGLREYWIWIVAVQFVLQAFVLMMLLISFAIRRGEHRTRPIVLKVLIITLATVLLESWLVWSVGWVIVIPLLGVTVLVLMDASWESLWAACIAVSVCGGFFALLTLDFSEFTPDHVAQIRTARDARKAAAVARYQHLVTEIDNIAPQTGAKQPPSADPTNDVPVSAAAPEPPQPPPAAQQTLNLESRIPLADRLIAQGIAPASADGAAPDAAERGWKIARSLVCYRGGVGAPGGKQTFLINGRIYDKHDTLKIICHGTVYQWFVCGGDAHRLQLKRLHAYSSE